MQNEDAIKRNVHQFGEVSHVLLHVDDAGCVITEHPEQVVHLDIDTAWLHARLIERLDDDTASGQFGTEVTVRQNHEGNLTQRGS